MRLLIFGANGQLGRELTVALSPLGEIHVATRDGLTASGRAVRAADLTRPEQLVEVVREVRPDVLINAAAYTAVDRAEEEPDVAQRVNAEAPAVLADEAVKAGALLVHYSTDYVFDGTPVAGGRDEEQPIAPLGVYGQSKAAGEVAVAGAARHYVLRTSWVIGDGKNFVRTMERLAADGVSPSVVDDQVGRLTFTDELARATRHLLTSDAAFGTYHVTNTGAPQSWAGYARRVFELCGRDPQDVKPVSTEEYAAGKDLAPRPRDSVLRLDKLAATGFRGTDADEALQAYLAGPLGQNS